MSSDRLPDGLADGSADEGDSDRGPSRDDVFHVLQSRRRRLVLRYVRERDSESASVENVAGWLATVEAGEDADDPDRSTVVVALRHVHLPKMAAADAVDYDPDQGVVKPTVRTDRFGRYLEDEQLPSPVADGRTS